jgi:SAM-dependent methyltransferase
MSSFDAYAAYYDLFYRDKDYAGEARYVDRLIRRHRADAKDILELGCGTGAHACVLADLGYAVTGVDRSDAMVRRAHERASRRAASVRPDFVQGDLRDFRAGRTFDAVLALFHVMSYQVANDDLVAAMATAAAHLAPGGLFVFDCWYGPGVLHELPEIRTRRLTGDGFEIARTATPSLYPNANRVDVHYDIAVARPDGTETIEETHSMRYLFAPEIDLLLASAGLTRIGLETWVDGGTPDLQSWNACFIAERR